MSRNKAGKMGRDQTVFKANNFALILVGKGES